MKRTICFLLPTLVLIVGASGALAQSYAPQATFAPSAPYYAADASDLESRIAALEADMKKKEDKVDTKKKFSADLSGRVFMDVVDFDNHPDCVGLRDARIGVSGKGFEIFDYKVELAFERELRLTDVYMGVQKVPGLDYVRIGHYKVETGLSYLTSGRNSTAMERPTSVSAFNNSRRLGIGQTYLFTNDQVRWFNGLFLPTDINTASSKYLNASNAATEADFELEDAGIIYNSRFSMVPYYDKDGERYFHIGGHYMYKNWGVAGNRGLPGTLYVGGFNRANNTWFGTGTENVDDGTGAITRYYNQGGLEAAWGRGPLAITSELFAGTYNNGRDVYGGYIEARYFLTGDCRPYSKAAGTLGNVKLKKNFLCVEDCFQTYHHGAVKGFGVKSWGAWEAYAQWGFVDTDRMAAKGGSGGRATDTALGLNWYWNPNTRMMFEYVHCNGKEYGNTKKHDDIFGTSFRFYF
jgi:phosphate-selective porin OprO/OprP